MNKYGRLYRILSFPKRCIKALFKFGYIAPLNSHQVMMLSDREEKEKRDEND